MLKGYDENGELKNVMVDENGAIKTSGSGNSTINNTNENPVPVVNAEVETVINSNVLTLSTTAQTINVGKKVTEISVANYSETANVTMSIGTKDYIIGANIATDLPINANVTDIILTSTEADNKFQIIIKGVE